MPQNVERYWRHYFGLRAGLIYRSLLLRIAPTLSVVPKKNYVRTGAPCSPTLESSLGLVSAQRATLYGGGAEGYTDYPAVNG